MELLHGLTSRFSTFAKGIYEYIQDERERSSPDARNLDEMADVILGSQYMLQRLRGVDAVKDWDMQTKQIGGYSYLAGPRFNDVDRSLNEKEGQLLNIAQGLERLHQAGLTIEESFDLGRVGKRKISQFIPDDKHLNSLVTVLEGMEKGGRIGSASYPVLYQLIETGGQRELLHQDQSEARESATNDAQEWRLPLNP